MKKLYLLTITSILLQAQIVQAQEDSSGIYFTSEDFQQHKISYAVNCKNSNEQIQIDLTHASGRHYFEIKHIDTRGNHFFKRNADEVFAYQNCAGTVYRIFDHQLYKMLNPNEQIIIYKRIHHNKAYKDENNKGTKYFFSLEVAAPLQNLTKSNLRASFSNKNQFLNALNTQFQSDEELYTYDSNHSMYKLNWLLKNNQ